MVKICTLVSRKVQGRTPIFSHLTHILTIPTPVLQIPGGKVKIPAPILQIPGGKVKIPASIL